jgi:mRNA interferase RelE/StbE
MPDPGKAASPAYRIFETRQFLRDLARLGPEVQKRLEVKLRTYVYPLLRQRPQFGPKIKRLRNWEPPAWRYRVGDWRFFYEIDERQHIVFMIAADHRREAYR